MKSIYEDITKDLQNFASEKRLDILFRLLKQSSSPTEMAKEVGSTRQEMHRNFRRLAQNGLIAKNSENYNITPYGEAICMQIPTLFFFAKNRLYFKDHCFLDIPQKYLMRIGQLSEAMHLKGVVKVREKHKSIIVNSKEYVYEMLSELPLERLPLIISAARRGVKSMYIATESALTENGRKKLMEKEDFSKFIKNDYIERKMRKQVTANVILNEREALLMLPAISGEPDLSQAFYSSDASFHEWCLDYFRYFWYNGAMWKEYKLKE
jgi:predicted transcriptional regulator